MPSLAKTPIRAGAKRLSLMLMVCTVLTACVGSGSDVTKLGFAPGHGPADPQGASATTPRLQEDGAVHSAVIAELQARRSVLPTQSAYAAIAQAVIEAGAGVAAAELNVARLKAEAKAKNWLPDVGPEVTLSALGAVAAGILLEQAVFDNGKRKAERAHAAADVELAAINLSISTNERVYEGLSFYLTAQMAREQASLTQDRLVKLREFERITKLRVEGGLSDGSELRLMRQRTAEAEATLAADLQTAATAEASLAAMTTKSLAGISGLSPLPADSDATTPLAVLRAKGEAARDIAEAQVEQASMMPGIGLTTKLGLGGLDGGLRLGGGGFGPGRKARQDAIAAVPDLAHRRTAEAVEESGRRIVALQREMAEITSRQSIAQGVLDQQARNITLYHDQYRLGRRSLTDLAQQYEAHASALRDHAALKYMAANLRLQIARSRGELVEGRHL